MRTFSLKKDIGNANSQLKRVREALEKFLKYIESLKNIKGIRNTTSTNYKYKLSNLILCVEKVSFFMSYLFVFYLHIYYKNVSNTLYFLNHLKVINFLIFFLICLSKVSKYITKYNMIKVTLKNLVYYDMPLYSFGTGKKSI